MATLEHLVKIYLRRMGSGDYLVVFKPSYDFDPKTGKLTPSPDASSIPSGVWGNFRGELREEGFIMEIFKLMVEIPYNAVQEIRPKGIRMDVAQVNTQYL